MKHVAVLLGGWSEERPVPLNAGSNCTGAREALGRRVTPKIVRCNGTHSSPEVGRKKWPHDGTPPAERFADGKESTSATMGDLVFDVSEIPPVSGAFYGGDAKYAKRGSPRAAPAKHKPNIYHKAQQLTQGVPRASGRQGISRADFRNEDSKGEEGEIVCLEVNTQPGTTETLLAPEMAARAKPSFFDPVASMAEAASCDR